MANMVFGSSHKKIIDITTDEKYETYLYRCLTGPLSKRYRKRMEYLQRAIPVGFHKKLLLSKGVPVGTIEYAPAESSYYPILGNNVTVMNCIWVLRKAKGHNLGAFLVQDMTSSESQASGFATVALENHWSPWFRKKQIEKLGFNPLDFVTVTNKAKPNRGAFTIYLMWMPNRPDANHPTWNPQKLLEGITCCTAHPLYHPQTYAPTQILART
ncbi:MAG: hypothetical protein JSV35_05735 [Candidatus Bathyarchaeota archaeon]|nr:MAG: hypothetical protein JSV35_05735 [Candidatus Bathyarchaeota archaeon]